MKKLLIIPAAVASFLALASPASAHTPTISAKCQTLTVDLKWYEQATVTVTIDGAATSDKFEGDWSKKFTGTKTWTVKVDDRGTKYDVHQSGTFVDCTPPTTVPTTTTAPVETPFDITVTQTVGFFGSDCDTNTAWVQFVNDGNRADRVSVGGAEVDVPANGFARVNLFNLGDGRFTFGPVTSLVNNANYEVRNAPQIDGTGAVSVVCASSVVLNRQILEPPVALAMTGARTTAMVLVGVMLLGFGFALAALGRKAV